MAAFAQTTPDPDAVLERARPLILDAIRHLPKYTCTQTVDRYYYRSQTPRAARMSCDDLVALQHRGDNAIKIVATDRLRLDVAVADQGREMYSWAGAVNLSSGRPDQIAGGPLGTGPFGSFLVDIFGRRDIHFLFHGLRILRLDHCLEVTRDFRIAFSFTSVESNGVTRPFSARLRHQIEFPIGGKPRMDDYFVRAHAARTIIT